MAIRLPNNVVEVWCIVPFKLFHDSKSEFTVCGLSDALLVGCVRRFWASFHAVLMAVGFWPGLGIFVTMKVAYITQ